MESHEEKTLREHINQILREIKSATREMEALRDTLSQPTHIEDNYRLPRTTSSYGMMGFMVASRVTDAEIRNSKIEREEGESYKIAINRLSRVIEHFEEERERMKAELIRIKTPLLLNYIPRTQHTQKGAIVKQLELAFSGRRYKALADKIIELCQAGKMRWPTALAAQAQQPMSECVDYDDTFFYEFFCSIPSDNDINYASFQRAMARTIAETEVRVLRKTE